MILQILIARKQKNLTQKEVAKQIGVTTSFYSMIENGKRKPSIETLTQIMDVLGIEKIDLREFN